MSSIKLKPIEEAVLKARLTKILEANNSAGVVMHMKEGALVITPINEGQLKQATEIRENKDYLTFLHYIHPGDMKIITDGVVHDAKIIEKGRSLDSVSFATKTGLVIEVFKVGPHLKLGVVHEENDGFGGREAKHKYFNLFYKISKA